MNVRVDAPNSLGWFKISGEKKHYVLETSFIPFGNVAFIEQLEKKVHVLKVERTKQSTGLYHICVEPENYPNPNGLTLVELIQEAVDDSKVFE